MRNDRARAGFTLTEMLISLGILALIGVVLTFGINTALSIYKDSSTVAGSQTLCSTLLMSLEDEMRFADEISYDTGASGALTTYSSPTFGAGTGILTEDGKIKFSCGENTYDVVSEATYLGHLVADTTITVADGAVTITVKAGDAKRNPDRITQSVVVRPVDCEFRVEE